MVQGLSSRTDTLNRAFDEIQYSRRLGSATTRHQATALYDAIYITADEILARDEIAGALLTSRLPAVPSSCLRMEWTTPAAASSMMPSIAPGERA